MTQHNDYITQYPRYFNGQFLQSADFKEEQEYHISRQKLTNRLLRVAGICEGLKVTVKEESSNVTVTVEAGVAINDQGDFLILKEKKSFNLASSSDPVPVYLTFNVVAFPEDKEDRPQVDNDFGTDDLEKGAVRREEVVTVQLGGGKPDGAVKIATINADFSVVREFSGIYLPSENPNNGGSANNRVALRSLNGAGDHAELSSSLTMQGDLTLNNSLKFVSGTTLTVTSTGAGDHAELSSSLTIQGDLKIAQDLLVMGHLKVGESTDDPYQAVVDLELAGHDTTDHPSAGKPGRHAYLVARANNANQYATDLGFRVRKDATWQYDDITDALTIRYDGNVGIGFTNPGAKLAVSGGLHIGGETNPGDKNLHVDGRVGIGTSPGNEHLKVGGNVAIIGDLSITKKLSVNQTSTLTGKVGIGTNPGSEQLKVEGDTSIFGTLSVNGTGNSIITGNLGIGVQNPQLALAIGHNETGLSHNNLGDLVLYKRSRPSLTLSESNIDFKVFPKSVSPQRIIYDFQEEAVNTIPEGFSQSIVRFSDNTKEQILENLLYTDFQGEGEQTIRPSDEGWRVKDERPNILYTDIYDIGYSKGCSVLDLSNQFCSAIKFQYFALIESEFDYFIFYYKRHNETKYTSALMKTNTGYRVDWSEFNKLLSGDIYDFRWVLIYGIDGEGNSESEIKISSIEITSSETTPTLSISANKGVIVGDRHANKQLTVHGSVIANSLQSPALKTIAVTPQSGQWYDSHESTEWKTVLSYSLQPIVNVYATIIANGHTKVAEGTGCAFAIFLNGTILHVDPNDSNKGFGIGSTRIISWHSISALASTQLNHSVENVIQLRIRSYANNKKVELSGPLMVIMLTGS